MDLNKYGTLIVLQSTSFCNINCEYCYLPDRSKKKRMSLDTLEKIYERVFQSELIQEPISFCWHLGEPLAVPISFYEEAFALAKNINKKYNKEIKHSFQTNATLINDDWIKFFRENEVEVGVSIDGPKFIHDKVRVDRKGKGTFDAVMTGIKKLQDAFMNVGAIMVLTDFSLDYPDEIFHFFKDSNIHYVGYNVDEIEGINKKTSFNDNSTDRYKRFLSRFIHLNERNEGVIKLREIWSNMKIVSGIEPYNTMNQAFRIFSFDYSGNYTTFCPELLSAQSTKYENFIMGNINSPIDNIVDNPIFKLVNSEIKQGLEECKTSCEYWRFCGGGAPSNKFFEHGTFATSETTTCRYHKKATVDVIVNYLEEKLDTANA